MRRKRFSPEQIVAILREASTGQETVEAVCRRHGISDTTFHRWKQLYEGQDTAEVRRARELAVENARLKRLLAERDLEIDALKSVLEKKR